MVKSNGLIDPQGSSPVTPGKYLTMLATPSRNSIFLRTWASPDSFLRTRASPDSFHPATYFSYLLLCYLLLCPPLQEGVSFSSSSSATPTSRSASSPCAILLMSITSIVPLGDDSLASLLNSKPVRRDSPRARQTQQVPKFRRASSFLFTFLVYLRFYLFI